jgi:symplekin
MTLRDKELFLKKSMLRDVLVSKFVSQHSMASSIFRDLFTFIASDVGKHYGLMIQWLNQEYSTELLKQNILDSDTSMEVDRYEKIINAFLLLFKEKLEPNDDLISRFLVDIPKITESCYQFIFEYIKDISRISCCLNALKDLIVHRETSRDLCLKKLLEFSVHTDETIQMSSISLIQNYLFEMKNLQAPIEWFILERLNSFSDSKNPVDWNADLVRSNISLFFSLCPKKTELIDKFIAVFVKLSGKMDEEPMNTLLVEFQKLIQILGTESIYLLNFLKTFDNNAETVALIIVQTLVESIKSGTSPSPDFVSTVKSIFFERNKRNAKFLLHLLPLLTKEEIRDGLKDIVKLPEDIVEEAFDRILMLRGSSQILSPAQLLIALHEIDATESKNLRSKIIKSIDICFKNEAVVQKGVLSIVIQNLSELVPIPLLTMATIIKSLQKCPVLAPVVIGVLKRLALKKVYQDPIVYQGFIKCIQMKELSTVDAFEPLLSLPKNELVSLLKENSTIQHGLSKYVNQKNISIKDKELKDLLSK